MFSFFFFSLIVKSINVFQLIRCVVLNVYIYKSMSISLENEFQMIKKKNWMKNKTSESRQFETNEHQTEHKIIEKKNIKQAIT